MNRWYYLAERLVAALERQASESSRLAIGQQKLIRLLEGNLAHRGVDVSAREKVG